MLKASIDYIKNRAEALMDSWGTAVQEENSWTDWSNIISEYIRRVEYSAEYDQGSLFKYLTEVGACILIAHDIYNRKYNVIHEIDDSTPANLKDLVHRDNWVTVGLDKEIHNIYAQHVKGLLPELHSPLLLLHNFTMGLTGETVEFLEEYSRSVHVREDEFKRLIVAPHLTLSDDLKEEIVSEAGDVMWYAMAVCQLLDITEIFNYESLGETLLVKDFLTARPQNPVLTVGHLNEQIKKWLYHSKDRRNDVIDLMVTLLFSVELLMSRIDVTLEEVMLYNIKKLEARYPNGFKRDDQ